MDLDVIKEKKTYGDFILVAKILGITPNNVRKSFPRSKSKYHSKIVLVLKMVIRNREKLIHK